LNATNNQLDSGRNYAAIDCAACGLRFYVPGVWEAARRNDRRDFVCPNGHQLAFGIHSEVERLKKEIAKEQERRRWAEERAETLERSRAAIQGQVTKLKNRAAAGLCPCCNRSFQNLARHMKTRHPGELPEGVLRSTKKAGRVPK
jgi:hypothetical protein